MIIYEIRVIASNMGIDPKKMNKTEIVLVLKQLDTNANFMIAIGEVTV